MQGYEKEKVIIDDPIIDDAFIAESQTRFNEVLSELGVTEEEACAIMDWAKKDINKFYEGVELFKKGELKLYKEVVVNSDEVAIEECAVELCKHYPYENKDADFDNISQAIKTLTLWVAEKKIGVDWCKSVASAKLSNKPIFIEITKDWRFIFLCGAVGQSSKEFYKLAQEISEKARAGKLAFSPKNSPNKKFGKTYFPGKKK